MTCLIMCVTAVMFVFAVRAHEIFCKLRQQNDQKDQSPGQRVRWYHLGRQRSPRDPDGTLKTAKTIPWVFLSLTCENDRKKGWLGWCWNWRDYKFFGSYIHRIVASIQNRCLKARAAGFIGWKFTCPDRRKITCADQVRFLANNPLPLGFAFGTLGPPGGFCRR